MQTRIRTYTSCVALTASLAVCSCRSADDGGADQAVADYLQATWGIVLGGFDSHGDNVLVADDGTQVIDDAGTITVDGLGTYDVSIQTIVSPASQGGQVSVFVSNLDLSDERYFLYDPVENYVTIGDLTRGVAVAKNPDDSYDVWAFDGDAKDQFSTVPDGYEALRLVEQYNEFKTLPPHLLLTAFAAAHGPRYEARGSVIFQANTAASPPVCEIFKEFCDCAACLVLDRQGACDLCPEL